ncbi:MAG: CheY-P phosphatase CheC [bacterium ADurb.Bin243]|nr:MAG: CheY-P phosphatase CheC [bacterium ADurb.Bin243]HOD39188.1 hypothetical protein [Candidatus Wallbacteria bacterium]
MADNNFLIDEKKLDQIRIIAEVSAENASGVISKWLKNDIVLNVLNVNMTTLEEIGRNMKLSEEIVFAAATGLIGDIQGHFLFIFKMEDAFKMVDMVLKRPIGTTCEADEVVQSVVLETCNIVGSSFSNSLVNLLRIKLLPSAPVVCCDLGGAVMSNVFSEYSMYGDNLFFIDTEYLQSENKISGYFFILPTPDSLSVMLKSLNNGTSGDNK